MASSLANRIKHKMESKNISAHALEKQAGLKASAIHNILYGRSKNPSISTLKAIANALDCTVSDLLEESLSQGVHLKENSHSYEESANLPWDSDLYAMCFTIVNSILKNKKIELSREKVLNLVDEVYAYSLTGHHKTVDVHFVDWLIEKQKIL